jgi:hypothetical protein
MSASRSHRIRAIAREQGRHVPSFTEAYDSFLRASVLKRADRARVPGRLADARIVDALNAQWRGQFTPAPAVIDGEAPKVKRISVAQSKSPPGESPEPPDAAAFVRAKAGPRVVDLFGSVNRRARQDVKDAQAKAEPVRLWPKGPQLLLRPVAIRVEARKNEGHTDHLVGSFVRPDGSNDFFRCDCGRTVDEVWQAFYRKVDRKLRRRRLAWWAR